MKTPTKVKKIVKKFKKLGKQGRFLVYMGAFAIIGGATLFFTHAVTGNYFFDTEDGNAINGATKLAAANAAGGSAVKFGGGSTAAPCPNGQVGTPPNCFSSTAALGVDARTVVNKFDRRMKGFGLGNWTFNWGRPYMNSIQGLGPVVSAIDPGLIRYAGGLKANYIGFDRNQRAPVFDTDWVFNGQHYAERYGTDELASLDAFAKSVNALVMIQVNLSTNDPSMWADLVRYAKEQGWTSFKYYEMANELDLGTFLNTGDKLDPATYASRVRSYQQAMLAVDSTIKIVGGVPATASDIMLNSYNCCGNQVSSYITQSLASARAGGKDLAAVSHHWYQNGEDTAGIFNWTFGNNESSGEFWRESYARNWSGRVTPWIRNAMSSYPNTEIGVSEINVNAADGKTSNGNHVGALWFSDVLGRLAYTGTNWATEWDGYVIGADEYFGLFYGENGSMSIRPTYYAYFMYNKYFGDQMVKSSTTDDNKISIWASKDSDDPGKLKLRITNMTGSAITTPIALAGFAPSSGSAYVMSSNNPLDNSHAGTTPAAGTTINGVKINAMNMAGSISAIQPVNVPVSGTSFNYTIPAYSSAAVVLSGSFN